MRGLFLTLTVLMITACLGGGHQIADDAECTANPEKVNYSIATTAYEDASSLRRVRRERPKLSIEEVKVQICLERLEFERIMEERRKRNLYKEPVEFKMFDPEPCFTKNCF